MKLTRLQHIEWMISNVHNMALIVLKTEPEQKVMLGEHEPGVTVAHLLNVAESLRSQVEQYKHAGASKATINLVVERLREQLETYR